MNILYISGASVLTVFLITRLWLVVAPSYAKGES
jgi:hypothetical protein